MAGFGIEQKEEVEAMIVVALKKQEDDIGAEVNLIIAQADRTCSELHSDMDRSKELHEAEVQALKDAEARGNELLIWHTR